MYPVYRPIKLVVAKCWDPQPPKGYFTVPRTEPVHPIDPGAWVAHTQACRAMTGRSTVIDTMFFLGCCQLATDDLGCFIHV